MESRIRFLTLNIGMKSNLAGLTTILETHKIDIAFLQEVKSSEDEINSRVGILGYTSKVNLDSLRVPKHKIHILVTFVTVATTQIGATDENHTISIIKCMEC